jgi:hypothetical protein
MILNILLGLFEFNYLRFKSPPEWLELAIEMLSMSDHGKRLLPTSFELMTPPQYCYRRVEINTGSTQTRICRSTLLFKGI